MTHLAAIVSPPRRVLRAVLGPRRKLALKIGVSAVLLTLLVRTTDRDALGDALLEVDVKEALLAVLVLYGLIAVQAWRWTFVARAVGISLPLTAAWLINQIGAFFNQVLPSSIGGDAMRVWRLHGRGVRTELALASVFLDRAVALVGTILLVAVGLPWLFGWMTTEALRIGVLAVVLFALAGVAILLTADRIPLVRRPSVARVLGRVLRVPSLARRVLLRPSVAIPALTLSVIVQLGVAFSVWLLARATGVDMSLEQAAFLVPLVILFTMVPITIAGWGVREGAMVVALGTIGIGREEALAISVLFGIASAIAALPGCVIWLATRPGRVGHRGGVPTPQADV